MSKIIENHLVNLWEWRDWTDYEMYGESEWSISKEFYDAYRDTPSVKECDEICAKLSGKVTVYRIKNIES